MYLYVYEYHICVLEYSNMHVMYVWKKGVLFKVSVKLNATRSFDTWLSWKPTPGFPTGTFRWHPLHHHLPTRYSISTIIKQNCLKTKMPCKLYQHHPSTLLKTVANRFHTSASSCGYHTCGYHTRGFTCGRLKKLSSLNVSCCILESKR